MFDFKLHYRAILIKTARHIEKKTADGDSDPWNYLAFSERGTKIHTGEWTAFLTTVLRRLGTPTGRVKAVYKKKKKINSKQIKDFKGLSV